MFSKLFHVKTIGVTGKMVSLNCNTFDIILRKSVYGFKFRLEASKNLLVKTLIESLFFMSYTINEQCTKILYNRT